MTEKVAPVNLSLSEVQELLKLMKSKKFAAVDAGFGIAGPKELLELTRVSSTKVAEVLAKQAKLKDEEKAAAERQNRIKERSLELLRQPVVDYVALAALATEGADTEAEKTRQKAILDFIAEHFGQDSLSHTRDKIAWRQQVNKTKEFQALQDLAQTGEFVIAPYGLIAKGDKKHAGEIAVLSLTEDGSSATIVAFMKPESSNSAFYSKLCEFVGNPDANSGISNCKAFEGQLNVADMLDNDWTK